MFCHNRSIFHPITFSSSESQVWKMSMAGSSCFSALFTLRLYWAMSQFCWSSRWTRLSGSPCSTFSPFDKPQYPVCWVSSETINFMRLILETVWPRCFDPCFHWHEGWSLGGHGLWPLCGDLCSTPLHSHPDILGTHEHHFVHCNFNSLAYTSHDLSHLPPTLLPGSYNNISFLLWAHGNCKTVLWKHLWQW